MSTDHHSDKLLLKAFKHFNRVYFSGELSVENVVLCWEPDVDSSLIASCMKIIDGRTDRETQDFIIRIDPRFQGSSAVWKLALLHEMVHIYLWPHRGQHPAAFDREIARLCTFRSYRRLL